jgi:hypothetical protein
MGLLILTLKEKYFLPFSKFKKIKKTIFSNKTFSPSFGVLKK